MTSDRLQKYLEERATFSPSYYKGESIPQISIDRMFANIVESIHRMSAKVEQVPQKEAILDGDSSKFYDFVSRPQAKDPIHKHSLFNIDESIKAIEEAQSLLPKLGYDVNLHKLLDMSKTLVEICVDSADTLFTLGADERAVELAYKADKLDKKYMLGINPYERVVEELMDDAYVNVKYGSPEYTLKRLELVIEVANRFNVALDISNFPFGRVIDDSIRYSNYLIGTTSSIYSSDAEKARNIESAIEKAKFAILVNQKYQVGKDQELDDLNRRLSAVTSGEHAQLGV